MIVSGILEIFDALPAWQGVAEVLRNQQRQTPLGLPMGVRAALVAKIYQELNVPILLLTGRVDNASSWSQALEAWLPEEHNLMRLPPPTPLPYDRGPWSDRSRWGRLQVLTALMGGQHPQIPEPAQPPLVVSSARAFLQKTLPKRRFMTATRTLRIGQILDLEKVSNSWLEIGYEAASVVESAGQFSRRGGIIDIYPAASPFPVRIELFGDEVDTMRYFDPATQRSTSVGGESQLQRLVIPPASEALPHVARDFVLAAEWEPVSAEENNLPSWQDDVADLQRGHYFPNITYYLPLLYPRGASLLDYLPNNALVLVDDWPTLVTAVHDLHENADQIANEQTSLPPNFPNPLFEWQKVADELEWWQPLILGDGDDPDLPVSELAEAFEPGPRYGGQMRPLMTQLKTAQQENERLIVVSRQVTRLVEMWLAEKPKEGQNGYKSTLLSQPKAPTTLVQPNLPILPSDGTLTFVQGSLAEGFTVVRREDGAVLLDLLTDAEIFGWKRPAPRRLNKPRSIAPETYFSDITAGDFVVHVEYGIGRFEGLVVRNIGGMEREYLLVRYANSDTLYVPVHHADRLGKWIGSEERPPSVHRLGERTWNKAKIRAQRAADELAGELLELYAARETVAGHAFSPDGEWQVELEASFPYQETEDQLRVIAEVKADMEKATPMDRLVCGDVGYGKTEVALRAAFKAVVDGKQVAILVPTTILAQQHFNTFSERLSPFPVKVEMLSRFRTQSQQERIVKGLRNGQVDIIIGTHRLVSDDVSFKDLGMVIIDEEQRFGVGHKEKLKQWRTEVDVLTMTATPIPRTLHMSLTGVRDISIINTAPAERLPVQTYVGQADETRLRRAILRELDRGGQAFVVHNRVQTINVIRQQIEKLVPDAIVTVAHGQMSERKLERIMLNFANKKIDILLSTTIIESGLDFPNANTLVVDRAEMFGLSQLYQLRGRVGRGVRRAYAYFFHAPWRRLTPEAKARLETIGEETQLGAGFAIANRDMEIRGAGDLLSGEQSGHVSLVGLDLYTKLIAHAVKQRKIAQEGGEVALKLPEDTLIDVPLAAYIPPDYVPDAALRLRLYRRMAMLDSLKAIDEMAAELADRFGPIPDPVDHLSYQLRIKVLAQAAEVTAVVTEAGQIKIRIPALEGWDRTHLQQYLGPEVRVSRKAVWMRREMSTNEWRVALVQVLEKLQGYVPKETAVVDAE